MDRSHVQRPRPYAGPVQGAGHHRRDGPRRLHDALADALFPRISSIRSRALGLFFIPWLYQRLQRRDGSEDIPAAARNAEFELIGAPTAGDDTEGVIGSRAREQLTRLPSSLYRGALCPPRAATLWT